MTRVAAAEIVVPGLGESYRLCRRLHAVADRSTYLATRLLLPPSARPHAHALYAFFTTSDVVADEGPLRQRHDAFAAWTAATLGELRAGRSTHPLRAAAVHSAGVHSVEIELFERFLAATRDDNTGPVEFATFEDLRRFLSGAGGAPAVMGMRLLVPAEPECDRLFSLLGEVFQLVDILRDFAVDLPAGRLYLPLADLTRFGVSRAEVMSGAPGLALDELVRFQVHRGRGMQREAAAVISMVPPRIRPFIGAAVDIHNAHFDLIDQWGARALRDKARLSPLSLLRRVLPHYRVARRLVAASGRTA
jgi:phytoene synthase